MPAVQGVIQWVIIGDENLGIKPSLMDCSEEMLTQNS